MRRRRRPETGASTIHSATDQRSLDLTDPFVAYLIAADTLVDVRDIDIETPLVQALRDAGAELVVPLISQSELVGVLSLGPRKGGQGCNAEDRRLLSRLATRAAPALRLVVLRGTTRV